VRALKKAEIMLIKLLLEGKPDSEKILSSLEDRLVQEMNDGGMGSLRFCSDIPKSRQLGEQYAQKEFEDEDGMPILVTIHLDSLDELYELDIWRVDFAPVKRFPS
jgi:hypothetical protein